jgi:hypothetical protein
LALAGPQLRESQVEEFFMEKSKELSVVQSKDDSELVTVSQLAKEWNLSENAVRERLKKWEVVPEQAPVKVEGATLPAYFSRADVTGKLQEEKALEFAKTETRAEKMLQKVEGPTAQAIVRKGLENIPDDDVASMMGVALMMQQRLMDIVAKQADKVSLLEAENHELRRIADRLENQCTIAEYCARHGEKGTTADFAKVTRKLHKMGYKEVCKVFKNGYLACVWPIDVLDRLSAGMLEDLSTRGILGKIEEE